MAKQNFLSGGYYGKLGVTVGQRWKNIRTIRSYVIPANPRTEKQMANRGVFTKATYNSQLAMQMNYNATCFESETMSRWNVRMKTARELQNSGVLDMDLLPLHPTTFTPPFSITSFKLDSVDAQNVATFAVSGTLPEADRVLSILFHLYDTQSSEVGYKLYVGNYSASNPGFITVAIDSASEINENCYVRLVSRDDTDSETDLISSPQIQIESADIEIRDFDTAVQSVEKALSGITITFAEPYQSGATTSFSGSIYGVSAGAFVTLSASNIQLENSGGYFAVTIPCSYEYTQQLLALPEGSKITISSISAIASTFEYTKQDEEIEFSDDDLTREIAQSSFSYLSTDTAIHAYFPLALSSGFAANGQKLCCSGRLGLTTEEAVILTFQANTEEQVIISVEDEWSEMPMRSGDYISIPAFTKSIEGVSYKVSTAFNFSIINACTSSTYFVNSTSWGYQYDGAGGDALNYLTMQCSIAGGISQDFDIEGDIAPFVVRLPSGSTFNAVYEYGLIENDAGDAYVSLQWNAEDETPSSVPNTSTVSVGSGDWGFTYSDGIFYELPTSYPRTLGDWSD